MNKKKKTSWYKTEQQKTTTVFFCYKKNTTIKIQQQKYNTTKNNNINARTVYILKAIILKYNIQYNNASLHNNNPCFLNAFFQCPWIKKTKRKLASISNFEEKVFYFIKKLFCRFFKNVKHRWSFFTISKFHPGNIFKKSYIRTWFLKLSF